MCSTTDLLYGRSCTSDKTKAPDAWLITAGNFEVDHCRSQQTDEQCSLQYSFMILLIVIRCDIAKIIAMTTTLLIVAEGRFVTLGDIIEWFLKKSDPYTRGCCLLAQEQARKICHKSPWRWWLWRSSGDHRYQHANRTFAEKFDPSSNLWKVKVTR